MQACSEEKWVMWKTLPPLPQSMFAAAIFLPSDGDLLGFDPFMALLHDRGWESEEAHHEHLAELAARRQQVKEAEAQRRLQSAAAKSCPQ